MQRWELDAGQGQAGGRGGGRRMVGSAPRWPVGGGRLAPRLGRRRIHVIDAEIGK